MQFVATDWKLWLKSESISVAYTSRSVTDPAGIIFNYNLCCVLVGKQIKITHYEDIQETRCWILINAEFSNFQSYKNKCAD
jgi:hypothetical protein